MILEGSHEFYTCVTNFFRFKNQETSSDHAALMANSIQLPIEKFVGYVKHLFDIVHKQKLSLTSLTNSLLKFTMLNELVEDITSSSSFNAHFKHDQANLIHLLGGLNGIDQCVGEIDMFFEHVVTMSKLNKQISTPASQTGLARSFDKIREALNSVKLNLSSSAPSITAVSSVKHLELKLAFSSQNSSSDLDKLRETLRQGNYFENMSNLRGLISSDCLPFDSCLSRAAASFEHSESIELNEELTGGGGGGGAEVETERLSLGIDKLTALILTSIEVLFKKYVMIAEKEKAREYEYGAENMKFYHEAFQNLTEDARAFNLENVNQIIKNLLYKQISGLINSFSSQHQANSSLDVIVKKFKQAKLFCDLFKQLCVKWSLYLLEMHQKSCKLLNVLIYVFDEYKQKGLMIPKEFEDDAEQEGEGDSSDSNRKFETSEDATGLGEGEGAKDVSDQIETEDQLEDAKRKEEYEKVS